MCFTAGEWKRMKIENRVTRLNRGTEIHSCRKGSSSIRPRFFPKIDGFGGAGCERQHDFLSRAGGCIGGEYGFEHGPAIFASDEGLLIVFDAVDKVGDFLRKAVVPRFFVNSKGPAFGRACFLYRVI